jgi:hypothetical protein
MFFQKVGNAVVDRKDLVIKFGATIILLFVLTIITRNELSVCGIFVFLVWMLAMIIYEAMRWEKLSELPVKSCYRRLNQTVAFMKLSDEFHVQGESDLSGHFWIPKGSKTPFKKNELVKKISA